MNSEYGNSGESPHLVDHLDLPESQTVQPVYFHHVALSMGLRQLETERESQGDEERGEKNTKTDVAAKTDHSMVADMQTGQPIMHKTQ